MDNQFSPERFAQAVVVQYDQNLNRDARSAAQRYINFFTEQEVSRPNCALSMPACTSHVPSGLFVRCASDDVFAPQNGWQLILKAFPTFNDGRVRFVLLNSLNWWIANR